MADIVSIQASFEHNASSLVSQIHQRYRPENDNVTVTIVRLNWNTCVLPMA